MFHLSFMNALSTILSVVIYLFFFVVRKLQLSAQAFEEIAMNFFVQKKSRIFIPEFFMPVDCDANSVFGFNLRVIP